MKFSRTSGLTAVLVASGLALLPAQPARAQNEIVAAGNGRFYVELRDASLADALELVFKAAGNPSHIIDEAAKSVNLAVLTFTNVQWDGIVRQLATQNNFKVMRNAAGTYIIEPRAPVQTQQNGQPGNAAMPGAIAPARGGGGLPANPFSGFGGMQARPEIRTLTNLQTVPDFGPTRAGGAGGDATTEASEYRVIPVQHVWEGAFAQILGFDVIGTEEFVSPGGGGGGGGGTGGNRGGGSRGGGRSGGGFRGGGSIGGGSGGGRSGVSGFGGGGSSLSSRAGGSSGGSSFGGFGGFR